MKITPFCFRKISTVSLLALLATSSTALTPTQDCEEARWLINNSGWGTLSYVEENGFLKSLVTSIADLDGRIFFYLGQDDQLPSSSFKASFTLSEAQVDPTQFAGGRCGINGDLDPEDPACSKLSISGVISSFDEEGDDESRQLQIALNTLFAAHPEMMDWPKDEKFVPYEMKIHEEDGLWMISDYGGASILKASDYFDAKPVRHSSDLKPLLQPSSSSDSADGPGPPSGDSADGPEPSSSSDSADGPGPPSGDSAVGPEPSSSSDSADGPGPPSGDSADGPEHSSSSDSADGSAVREVKHPGFGNGSHRNLSGSRKHGHHHHSDSQKHHPKDHEDHDRQHEDDMHNGSDSRKHGHHHHEDEDHEDHHHEGPDGHHHHHPEGPDGHHHHGHEGPDGDHHHHPEGPDGDHHHEHEGPDGDHHHHPEGPDGHHHHEHEGPDGDHHHHPEGPDGDHHHHHEGPDGDHHHHHEGPDGDHHDHKDHDGDDGHKHHRGWWQKHLNDPHGHEAHPHPDFGDDAVAHARWLVSRSFWGTISTISSTSEGQAFGNIRSIVDGACLFSSTGQPIFYLPTPDHSSIDIEKNNQITLSFTEAALAEQVQDGSPCGGDDADPTCAKITLSGNAVPLDDDDDDDRIKKAEKIFKIRHPRAPWLANGGAHTGGKYFTVDVKSIAFVRDFSGVIELDVDDYLAHKADPKMFQGRDDEDDDSKEKERAGLFRLHHGSCLFSAMELILVISFIVTFVGALWSEKNRKWRGRDAVYAKAVCVDDDSCTLGEFDDEEKMVYK